MYEKEVALWALANQDPSFVSFHEQYQNEMEFSEPLPTDFIDEVMTVVEADPAFAETVKHYQENAQAAMTFAIPGLSEVSILIAVLFLLSSYIKIHRTPDGKWELLVEHKGMESETLEKIAQTIATLLKK